MKKPSVSVRSLDSKNKCDGKCSGKCSSAALKPRGWRPLVRR